MKSVPNASRRQTKAALIVQSISLDIACGKLKERERLPPEDRLATRFRVSVGTVQKANEVLEGSGLQMRETECWESTVSRKGLNELVVDAGVRSVRFFRPSPIGVNGSIGAQVYVNAVGVGEEGDGFVVRTRARRGELIVIAQSLWWHWIWGEQTADADNGKLLSWFLMPPKGK